MNKVITNKETAIEAVAALSSNIATAIAESELLKEGDLVRFNPPKEIRKGVQNGLALFPVIKDSEAIKMCVAGAVSFGPASILLAEALFDEGAVSDMKRLTGGRPYPKVETPYVVTKVKTSSAKDLDEILEGDIELMDVTTCEKIRTYSGSLAFKGTLLNGTKSSEALRRPH